VKVALKLPLALLSLPQWVSPLASARGAREGVLFGFLASGFWLLTWRPCTV